ncbi:MAG: hypothetical protein HZB55_15705 [Deltaproteobacteria bacterium]|nr:hypothetical protein [Deltaproteobacteria bacterium]
MRQISKLLHFWIVVTVAAIISSCAGVKTSSYSFNDTYKTNIPIKGDGCYDAAVLLDKSFADSKEISKKVLAAIDSTISEETATRLTAQRNRHMGVFVGSGGEELLVTLQEVSGNRTFVTAATKTGLVGGAGQKAWSCQIVDQIVAMASN